MIALLLFSFAARAQPGNPGKGRQIVGSVVDVDGNPIANAMVTVSDGGPSATTAADGSFKLAGVATANVAIAITADGFTAKQVPVLGAATALQLQVVLVKPAPAAPPPVETRMVGGVVSDAAHAPIAGATVRVHGTELQGVTSADGSFSLPGVAIGEVTLDVEAANQPPVSVVVPADRAAVAVTVGGAAPPPPPATRTIRGKVTESSGEPLAAATVQVAGIPEATVFTEADGTFVFENLPAGKITLDITAPGHEAHVLELPPGKDSVTIPLGLATGEQIEIEGRAPSITKQNITGGGSVIKGQDLTRVAAPTLDDAMVGKLAGANLQANSGAPGGGAQLRLRGISTINGQNSPLYVIDGVIISNIATSSGINAISAAAAGGNPSNQDNPVNRIADLNPNDIENVEVLKGASAAALYGSKAANGVVIITTKRGKQGENRAEVTQRVGFSQVSKGYAVRQWHSLDEVKNAFCDDPADSTCDNNKFVKAYMASGGKNFDHEAEIMRVPFLRETLASVTGGTENGNYYGSVLLADEPGVMQGTFYNKQTGKISVGYKFGDHVKLSLTANLLHSLTDRGLTNNDNAGVSVYDVISATPSFFDMRPVNGIYPKNPGLSQGTNLLQNAAEFQNREDLTRLIAGVTTTVDAYQSSDNAHRVLVRGNLGIDTFDQKNNVLSPPDLNFEQATGLPGRVIDGTTTNTNMNLGTSAVWNFTPHSGGYRSALTAGLTYESVDTHSVYVFSRNLIQPKVDTATVVRSNEALLRTKEAGGYLQEELTMLDDRLALLGGLLTERSSLNGDNTKSYLYPKLGAAYSLIKPAKSGEAPMFQGFESLRVRAAYGETGNRPNYGQKFTPLQATNTIGGSATLVVLGTAGDAVIEPERQREIEGGVDMATKDQRIVAEVTGYQRNISNMLLSRALATSTGFNTQFLNGGALRNRGVETAVAVKPVKGFDWTTRATLTLNRSMVTELPPGIAPFNTGPSFGAGFGIYRIEVGKSATQIVSTTDGTGTLSVVGNGEPDFRIGWSNVVNVGDFAFSTLLDWQQGSKIINLTQNYFDANGNATDQAAAKMRTDALDNGDPRPYIEDGTFVKVREISVAYTLPKRLTSQLGPLKSLQVSLSGRNLLTFAKYSGLDPEVSNFGSQAISRNYDVTPYPPSRTFWLSVTAGI